MRSSWFGSATAMLGLLLLAATAVAEEARDADPSSAASILERAFEKRYEIDLTSQVELVMRDKSQREHRRVFEAASKMIDGRLHSVGRLSWPHYLRDMTILTIEAENRDRDAFVYLPSLGRVRRISTAQKGDAFFGTDVTYEDLERRRANEFTIVGFEDTRQRGEAAYRISGEPLAHTTYDRVEYVVAKADDAILAARYFKDGSPVPHRTVRSDREAIIEEDGHLIPTRLVVENRARGTTTTATFRELVINPEIDDSLFSASALETRRKAR